MLTRVIGAFLLFILLVFLLSSQAQAAGIGVAPPQLELEAHPLGSTDGSINVLNPSSEKSLYNVYVEGDCQEWFSITPAEFVLDPQGSQKVMITLSPPLIASGEHDVSVCIVALTPASELKAGCGVKIPTHIHVIAPPPLSTLGINVTGLPLLGIGGATLTGMITGIVVWRRRRFHEV